MRNWTIGKRLVMGFAAIIALATLLGGYAVMELMALRRTAFSITTDVIPGLTTINHVRSAALENEVLIVRHIEADTDAALKGFEADMAAQDARQDEALKAYEVTIQSDRDRALFNAVGPLRATAARIRNDDVLPLSRADKTEQVRSVYETRLRPANAAYVQALTALVEFNEANGKSYSDQIDASVNQAVWTITIGALLAIGLGIILATLIVRTVKKTLNTTIGELTDGAHQVASASSQVATSAQALSQGASEQAASLEETSASMEEMASMTRKNAENSQTAAGLMADVDQRVQESDRALGDMVTAMTGIQESSQQVAKIIKTIDEIAFQTNILALNAAVEAARAGEAGMGFAVVADEVRNLAQRSAQAAKDTAALIDTSIARSQEGHSRVEHVGRSIAAITESISQVKGLVEEVSVASQQQSQGIDQVSQAVAQMEKVTQTTAASAEEGAAASEQLSAQADDTLGAIRRLEAFVGGAAPSAPPAGRPASVADAKPGHVVVKMPASRPTAKREPSAEEMLPLSGTGTYGRF